MTDALELFRGGGGWACAARDLGIDDYGVEIMPEANATAEAAGFKTLHDDVWTLDVSEGDYDTLIASPPCQTFSAAGKGAGRKALEDVLTAIRNYEWTDIGQLRALGERVGDERTALVLTPLHHAHILRPRAIAWEQVPTVLPVWEACAEQLRLMGYSVWTGNLQAEQYGVPQTRKRAFLIARRDAGVAPPAPTHSRYYPRTPEKLDPGVEQWVSMAEALVLSGLVDPFDGSDFLPIGQRSNYSAGGKPGQTAADRGRSERPVSHPSFALTSKGFHWILKDGRRRVSVAEAGVLQSFPVDHPWLGDSSGSQRLQIGNACPPLLAKAVLGVTLDRA